MKKTSTFFFCASIHLNRQQKHPPEETHKSSENTGENLNESNLSEDEDFTGVMVNANGSNNNFALDGMPLNQR